MPGLPMAVSSRLMMFQPLPSGKWVLLTVHAPTPDLQMASAQ